MLSFYVSISSEVVVVCVVLFELSERFECVLLFVFLFFFFDGGVVGVLVNVVFNVLMIFLVLIVSVLMVFCVLRFEMLLVSVFTALNKILSSCDFGLLFNVVMNLLDIRLNVVV